MQVVHDDVSFWEVDKAVGGIDRLLSSVQGAWRKGDRRLVQNVKEGRF